MAEAETLANEDLARTLGWFNANKLVLNIKKTKFLIFSSRQKQISNACNLQVDGKALCQVDAFKYLGVTLDSSMHWAQHIDTVCKKLSFGCFTLVQARKHFTKTTLRLIYFSIFHSHLTYCIESWGYTYASYCAPINILQKRAVRIIASEPRTAPSSPIFKELNIMRFNQARDYKTALLVKRVICTNTPYHSSILSFPSRNTRHANNNNLNLPKISNVYGRRSLPFVGTKLWNRLPHTIKVLTQNEKSIKTYIMSDTYSSPS